MARIKSFAIVFACLLFALPAFAQAAKASKKADAPTEVSGTVQSFSGNILDIKPPTTAPAVWVTIPSAMKIDRAALKPGVRVSVEARWATVAYVALKPPKIIAAKSASQ